MHGNSNVKKQCVLVGVPTKGCKVSHRDVSSMVAGGTEKITQQATS